MPSMSELQVAPPALGHWCLRLERHIGQVSDRTAEQRSPGRSNNSQAGVLESHAHRVLQADQSRPLGVNQRQSQGDRMSEP
jgi:hypothetical protein